MRGKADRALTMMVSMEHHSTDENQNKAVIGDKLMYGVIDPEPGIIIQKYRPTSASTNTHTLTAFFTDRPSSKELVSLADMQVPGQRALFRVHDC